MSNQYTDVYDHNWNLNEIVTKLFIRKRCILGKELGITSKSLGREPNNPKFRDKQIKSLKG